MDFSIRCGAIVLLLLFANACSEPVTPIGPSPIATAAPPVPAAPATDSPTAPSPPSFPAVSRPARVYLFADGLQYPVRHWTRASRYVLYDDGTFVLQYSLAQGVFGYHGTYLEAGAVITFRWEANQDVAAPWHPATGTLSGDLLTVRYDPIMHWDDFEDAVYARAP